MESSQNWVFLVGCIGLCLLLARPAGAELYIAGQVGATFPQDVTNIQGIGSSEGISVSDFELQTSVLYGGKLGYFFPRSNWLGIETEAYTTTPSLKQQVLTITGPGGSISTVLSGKDVRVTTLAFNLVTRYPSKRIQPYAGVGVGVFFLGIPMFELDTSPGVNVFAGSRFFLTKRVALFTEYKFNHTTFNFEDGVNFPVAGKVIFEGDYTVHHLLGGISYHF